MTPPEYHAKPKKSKSKNWFYHDADARRDPKLIYLQQEGGFEFKGIWWDLIEYLRETDGYKVPSKLFKSVLLSLGTSTEVAEKFLKTCLFCELLVEKESSIYSESLIDRMSGYEAICERNKANAKRPLSGRRARRQRAIPIPDPVPDLIPDQIQFPPEIALEVQKSLTRWCGHLLKNHRRKPDQMAIDAILMSHNERDTELIENINYSISNGWKTICIKPSGPDPNIKTKTKFSKNFQDGLDLMEELKREEK